jgi:hypothetical protein
MGSVSAQAPTRTYEIQRFANGRWLLDSVGDDKKVAVAMANALFKSGRAPMGVQVMAVQRGGDGQFSEARIYRLTPDEQESAAVAQAKASTLPKPKVRVERPRDAAEAVRRPAARAARRRSDFSLRDWRAWAAIGFLLAWCAVFYIWQQPQKPWAFDRPEAQTNVKQRVPLP